MKELESSPPAATAPGKRRTPVRTELYGTRDGWRARLEYYLVRAAIAGLLCLPDRLREAAIQLLARVARRWDKRHTQAAHRYLAQALGRELDPKLRDDCVLASYASLARMALDTFVRPKRVREERWREHFELEFSADFEELLRQGGPVAFITCHVGDWEASGVVWKQLGFYPLNVIAKPARNRPLSIWIQKLREASGHRVLSRYGATQEVVSAVAQGGSLGLILDHRATMRPIWAPFFGRPAACERASGILLRRLKIPAVITACYRTSRRWHYRVVTPRVFWPAELAQQSPEEIVTAINRELELLIRAAPEQYYWLHDRFRGKCPPEVGALYTTP